MQSAVMQIFVLVLHTVSFLSPKKKKQKQKQGYRDFLVHVLVNMW